MTDWQIADFIVHRAKVNGNALGLKNPKLVIRNRATPIPMLAVKYDNSSTMFIRFTKENIRSMFKLNVNDKAFAQWHEDMMKEHGKHFEVVYDIEKLPSSLVHFVSYSVIEALKTDYIGLDLFGIDAPEDICIIKPSETYEEVSINADLLCLGMPELES